jgi:hypothetical protein
MANVLVTPERIRETLKTWIDEASNDDIQRVFNSEFDDEIFYEPQVGCFEVPQDLAVNLGLDL